MRLIILGAVPPPRGGVSTHVERLLPYLDEAGIRYIVLDHSNVLKHLDRVISLRRNLFQALWAIIKYRDSVLHYPMSSISISRFIFIWFMKNLGIRLTLTLVGEPGSAFGKNRFKRFLFLRMARWSKWIVANNSDFKKFLLNRSFNEDAIHSFSAYIPYNNDEGATNPIPEEINEFCRVHSPLILTYAFGPTIHNGVDLYGLDMIIELARALAEDYPRAGYLVVFPEITNEEYFRELMDRTVEFAIDSQFHFVFGDKIRFVSLLKYANLFIRATNTDGDALTLREAWHADVPCVASDASLRPEGTFLFINRDAEDLERAVRKALSSPREDLPARKECINNAHRYIKLFMEADGGGLEKK